MLSGEDKHYWELDDRREPVCCHIVCVVTMCTVALHIDNSAEQWSRWDITLTTVLEFQIF